LNREVFANLKEAQVLAGDYHEHYNLHRPHAALGYLTLWSLRSWKSSRARALLREHAQRS
jgi:transposase InsO family protein